jgi:hypothetical protein
VLRGQYQALLRILAHKPALDAMDDMSVVYYLFLQDRTEEALARFATIKPDALPTKLQHDYFRCYAAFYEEKLPDAREDRGDLCRSSRRPLARALRRGRGATRRDRGQSREARGRQAGSREAAGRTCRRRASFDIKVENRTLALTWKNLREVTVNYYLMDPEFLFSANPFVSEDSSRFLLHQAHADCRAKAARGQGRARCAAAGEFAKANVLVEVLAAGQRKAQAYHANTFKLTLSENYGRSKCATPRKTRR